MTESTNEDLKKDLDKVFSEYIRKRDCFLSTRTLTSGKCITCNKFFPYSELDCGHYVPRSNMSTRWHEDNCHAQCIECNRLLSGNLGKYSETLKKAWIGDKLERLGKKIKKYSQFEMLQLKTVYREKINNIKKLLGLI